MADSPRSVVADRLGGRIRAVAARQPRPEDFTSPLHDERVVARVGAWLGLCLVICFITGLISHYLQGQPPWWLPLGPNPSWGYRVTQGAHVISGTLMLPLLLAKLFSAYPRLFTWPPVTGVVHALDRGSIAVLIAATAFQIITGFLNTVQWYPWTFSFTGTHYVVAYAALGSLLIHIATKLPVTRRAFSRPLDDDSDAYPDDGAEPPLRFAPDPDGRTRRSFLIGVGVTTVGVGLLTAGQTVAPLRHLALLSPRRPGTGPQGLPINRTAEAAQVTETAAAPDWQLTLAGPSGERTFSRAELGAMTQHEESLPIACVEGWSAQATWKGVRMKDLVSMVGGGSHSQVHVESLEQGGYYGRTTLPASWANDQKTLLALTLNGEPLHVEHGYPARIMAPNRPGVLQTKWVSRLTVTDERTTA